MGLQVEPQQPAHEIYVDGVRYVADRPADADPLTILIAQRGWAFVGRLRHEGDFYHLSDASVIRQWGTTNGLGEIALGGPTSKTKLDPVGTVTVHQLATVALVGCDSSKW